MKTLQTFILVYLLGATITSSQEVDFGALQQGWEKKLDALKKAGDLAGEYDAQITFFDKLPGKSGFSDFAKVRHIERELGRNQ
jgi:hypothetical protein